jgi:SWI/SNF-related matrix-associated actin-dependent regulator 1 of chromatin subfamily A
MPFDRDALPWLRAMPGARWDPGIKRWRVSTDQSDRPRVLEIASKLNLDVAESLQTIEKTREATQADLDGLYPYQVHGVDHLSRKSRALLADEMGLGKTVQALRALSKDAKAIAVVPASLKYNWAAECKRWRPDLKPVVLSGRKSYRPPSQGELVIINYDILPDVAAIDAGSLRNVVLIVDEAHKVKSHKAKRSKRIKALADACAKVWALTGTPLLGKPFDLWGVLSNTGMQREVFGWQKFLMLFGGHQNRWGGWEFADEPSPEAPERLRRVMMRRLRKDVLPDLPSKTYTDVVINGTSKALERRLDQMMETWSDTLEDEMLPSFEEFSGIRRELAESRIPAIEEMADDAEESNTPIIVFSAHRAPVEHLGSRDGWAKILGGTSSQDRQAIVEDFQAGRLKGLALTIGAGGVGLTLTRAWKAIFVDLDWTPANNLQAEDRICRIGQTSSKVEIVRLVSDHPIDRRVQKILCDKQRLITAAIEREGQITKPETTQGETQDEFEARMKTIREAEEKIAAEERDGWQTRQHTRQTGRCTRTLLPLTPERKSAVKDAFQYLLSVCDGAVAKDAMGYNKPDAVIAHRMLSYGLESDREMQTAYAIVTRYHRQLSARFPVLFSDKTGK